MFPKEKINRLYKNPNTRLFYKEYNNKCNPNKLLNIARKGIELYEPLNSYKFNHSNIIDISNTAKQTFMITTLNQYRRFNRNIKYLNNINGNDTYFLNIKYNRFITKYSINDNVLMTKYITSFHSYFICFIFIKAIIYNYIDNNCYVFFTLLNTTSNCFVKFINFYDYFYFNKKLLMHYNSKNCSIYCQFLNEFFDKNILHCINKNFIISLL